MDTEVSTSTDVVRVGASVPGHYPCFDGLRAVAALMVIVYHSVFFATSFRTLGGSFLANLNAGVWVFFVASGFLLYRPFAAAHLNTGSPVSLRVYALRRFARIYPAYWAVIAFFSLVVHRAVIVGPAGFFRHVTLTFTYVHVKFPFGDGLPPAWSLVVEMSFYAFLPLYAYGLRALSRARPAFRLEVAGVAALAVLGFVAIVAVSAGYSAPWIAVLPQHLIAFAFGMALAVVSANRFDVRTQRSLEALGRRAWVWWSAGFLAFMAVPIVFRIDFAKQATGALSVTQGVALNLCAALLGLFLVFPAVFGPQDQGTIRRLMRSRVLTYLGVISYGLYLWHWFILEIVLDSLHGTQLNGNWVMLLLLGLPVVIGAATVSWYLLERPIVRWARGATERFRLRRPGVSLARRSLDTRSGLVEEPSPHRAPLDRRKRRVTRGAVGEAGAYALAMVVVMWPVFRHIGTRIIGGTDDARYYTWLGWRIGHLIANGDVAPARISDAIVPYGLDLRLLDGYLPTYIAGLYNTVLGPILAFNLTFVTGAALNLLGARSMARRLSPRRVVWVISAIAFLTAPPIALGAQLGLLPLFFAFTVPVLIGDAIDVARHRTRVRAVRLTVLLVLAYLCSVYFLVFGGLAYGAIVGIAALRRSEWRIPFATAVAVAATFMVLLPFIVPRISYDREEHRNGGQSELLSDSNLFSADALSILAQPTRSTILLPRPTAIDRALARLPDPSHTLEGTIFPGLLLIAGFIVFSFRRSALRVPIVCAAAVTWVLALGPSLKVASHFVWTHGTTPVSWLPYRLLLGVPGFGALRAPNRGAYALVALFVAATAVVLHELWPVPRRRGALVACACALVLATNLLIPLPTGTLDTTHASAAALRRVAVLARPGDTVMEVPNDCDPAFVSYQVFHHTPVMGCAGSFAANPWSRLRPYAESPSFAALRCDPTHYGRVDTPSLPRDLFAAADVHTLMTQFGVRFVIVDLTALTPACGSVRAAIGVLEQYRSLGRDGRLEVLDLSALR